MIISSKENHTAISSAFGGMVSHLSHLIFVVIPVQVMTPELFEVLSRLPNLEELAVVKWRLNRQPSGGRPPEVKAGLKRKLIGDKRASTEHPQFHSIKDFYLIDERNFKFTQVHDLGIRFLNLLHLTCSPLGQPDEINATMELVHIACPNLHTIRITRVGKNRGGKKKSFRLPWKAVEVVLKCPHLHSLTAFRAIDIDLDNITTLAENRSFWKPIELRSINAVGYQALISFAQNCPNLTVLSLTFGKDDELPSLETYETGGWFPSLALLGPHESPITFPIQVGRFIANVCKNALQTGTRGKHVAPWKVVQDVVNSINLTDPDAYYKEVDLGDGDYI